MVIRIHAQDDVCPATVVGSDASAGEADARLRAVLGAVASLVVQLDVEGRVTFVNEAFLDATGWARGDVVGADWGDGFVPASCETRALVAAAIGGVSARGQGELFTLHGDLRRVAWEIVALRDDAGRPCGAVCIGRDVTDERRAARERTRLTRELAARVDRDALTGLLNRRGFVRETAHAVRVAARNRRTDAVLCVRVDGLAAAYATHGDAAGDDAVCSVAELLRGVVRDSDVIARIADDAFAVYAVGTGTPHHGAA
ncbi:MAG TPA: GGDEF domain-containing protein, partial [Gemmatirosa sp.]